MSGAGAGAGAAAGGGLGPGAGSVDYAWLQEQLAELSRQLSTVGLEEDDYEDEVRGVIVC
jgi:hypothetical protein